MINSIMKYINIFFIILTEIVLLVNSENNENKFLPNLPVGPFRLNYKGIIKCDLNPNSVIHRNFYLSKMSKNTVGLKGNFTLIKPLDDSFSYHLNFAVKDSIGGWKNNAHVYSASKACSTMKQNMGPKWNTYCSMLGLNSTECPIQPGVYHLNNYSLSTDVSGTNYPKTFFYGTYKIRSYYTDNLKNEHGCIAFIVEVKRPWEMD